MYKKLKEQIAETTQYYMLRNVHPRVEQPFQIRDDERMEQLVEIIRLNGVLNPLIVTTKRGSYEIVSGHRRDATDIVEKIELRHLLVSHDFCDCKQQRHRKQRCQYDLDYFHFHSNRFFLVCGKYAELCVYPSRK